MSKILTGSEVIELGIQIEINGRDFYNALVTRSKSETARGVFKYLAGEEEKHIGVFKGLLESVENYEPSEAYAGEYLDYMKALASEHIFTNKGRGKKAADDTKTDEEAIGLGIKFEKDSIIFYEGAKKIVPEYDHKIIDKVIVQEQGHLVQLNGLKKGKEK